MSVAEFHPSNEQLAAFAIGRVSAHEANSIEDHLTQCSNCTARLDAVSDSDDGLISNLRLSLGENRPRVADTIAAGTVLAGRYCLIEVIGHGGMGTVWLAKQVEPVQREVAVKLIRAGFTSPSALSRFESERHMLAQMDHPNIAKFIDAGVVMGASRASHQPYFVMELVRGVPITEYCAAHQLSLHERLRLFATLCQAIQHAHQKGIIHRDIKPSNVLISERDDGPMPKVIDFGVAKAVGEWTPEQMCQTLSGSVVGTLEYMSPEQAGYGNQDVDTRSDVYSLGALLYDLMTGAPPFQQVDLAKAGMAEALRMVREVEPAKPSTRVGSHHTPMKVATLAPDRARLAQMLRGDIDWIVLKALEKDRSRRYETANGLRQDVLRFLSGDPVLAAPPTPAYRLRKFVRKHRGPVIAAGLLVISLITGTIGTALGLIRAESEKARALNAEADARDHAKSAEAAAAAERQARDAENKVHADLIWNLIDFHSKYKYGTSDALENALRGRLGEVEAWIDHAQINDVRQLFGLRSRACDAFKSLDDLPRSLIQGKKALQIAEANFGSGDADTLAAYFRLASIHDAQGNRPAADDLRRRAATAFQNLPALNNDQERKKQWELMLFLREWAGETKMAVTLAERLLDDAWQHSLNTESTIPAMEAVAWALQRDGQADQALAMQRRMLKLFDDSAPTAVAAGAANNAQQLMVNTRRFDKDIYEWVLRVVGPEAIIPSVLALGGSYFLEQKQWLAAETMLRQCLAKRLKAHPDDWTAFNAQSLLGASLLGQQRYQEAEPLLLAGFEGLRLRVEKIPKDARHRVPEAAERLVALYTALGNTAEVEKWRSKAQKPQ